MPCAKTPLRRIAVVPMLRSQRHKNRCLLTWQTQKYGGPFSKRFIERMSYKNPWARNIGQERLVGHELWYGCLRIECDGRVRSCEWYDFCHCKRFDFCRCE